MDMTQTLNKGDPGHQAVTAEERAEELNSQRLFREKVDKVNEDRQRVKDDEDKSLREASAAQLGTLARLMRHDKTSTENLVLEDEDGQFAIPVCYMSRSQRQECVQIVVDLGLAGAEASGPTDNEDPVKTIDSIYERLANLAAALVTDEELSEGIRKGATSDGKNMMIVQFSLKRSVAMEESGSTFRVN